MHQRNKWDFSTQELQGESTPHIVYLMDKNNRDDVAAWGLSLQTLITLSGDDSYRYYRSLREKMENYLRKTQINAN